MNNGGSVALAFGIGIVAVALIFLIWSQNHQIANSQPSSTSSASNWRLVSNASVFVSVGEKPKTTGSIADGTATVYLPIKITYRIAFAKPANSFTIFEIDSGLWRGGIPILNSDVGRIFDANTNKSIPFNWSAREGLFESNATCIKPFPAKVDTGDNERFSELQRGLSGSSLIPMGDITSVSFLRDEKSEPADRNGTYYFTQPEGGIVPLNYTISHPSYSGSGIGNSQSSGLYHLMFSTVFNDTTVHVPRNSLNASILKEACYERSPLFDGLSNYVYIFDVWFRMS